jgi:anaerobic selenocysteine-containing dehydrogenase
MRRSSERGGATLQFVIVMAVLGAVGYAGYLYVPVAYQAHMYKDLMQHYADVTSAQGYKPAWAGEQLLKNAPEYNIPANAVITPVLRDSRIEIRVQYVQPVEFPGYTYNYEFDYTAKSTAFLAFK